MLTESCIIHIKTL